MRRAAVSQKLGRDTHLQTSAGVLNGSTVRRWFKSHDFPGGSDSKASAYNAGDPGSIPASGRSPGEGNGNPFQYSCLENPKDGGAWWAAVHGLTKSQTRLSDFTFTFKSLVQFFGIFVYLWPFILFLSSHLIGPWTLPKICQQLLRWVPPQRPVGASPQSLCLPSPFDSEEALLHMCRQGVFCLRSAHLISLLQQSLAFDTSLFLQCLGENNAYEFDAT